MSSEDEIEVLYEVQAIEDKRIGRHNLPEYLVRWKGFKQRTWEPVANLENVLDMIY